MQDFCFRSDNWIADEVTIDGVMYRKDYPVLSPEGQKLCAEVLKKFPNEKLDVEDTCSIGRNEAGMRPPYTNDTISWYTYGTLPPELALKYKVQESVDEYATDAGPLGGGRMWYGFKYDLVTGEKMLKMPVDIGATPIPEGVPGSPYSFLGKLYHEDGTLDDKVDLYLNTPQWLELNRWFRKNKYNLTITAEDYLVPHQFCFGIVYSLSTLEIAKVKIYKFLNYPTPKIIHA